MGLDFSHGNVSFSYSGFHRFREALAAEENINLGSMIGFGGRIQWSSIPDKGLHALLNHSDCDGELVPEQLEKIISRLQAVALLWPNSHEFKPRLLALIEGMQEAFDKQESFEFI